MKLVQLFGCVATLSLAISMTALADPHPPLGTSTLIAHIPFPGYPEGIVVHEGVIYVSGPAAFGVPGNASPSAVFAFDLHTGALLKTITIENQTGPLKSLSCIAVDDDDNLYVLDETQGVVKIDLKTGKQSVYSAPFYPVYHSAYNPPAPILLNDLAFDKEGNIYITDSFEATIWKVKPGGGAPEVWFQSALIDGPFGPNGLRVSPDGSKVYFDVTFTSTNTGVVFTLPVVDHPQASDLKVFHTYPAGAGPDGFAFGKSGSLYVCLAGYSQISVLDDHGNETARYSGPATDPAHPGSPLPWANPANIAFDGHGYLLSTNHASLTGLADPSALFAVFNVWVDDKAGKLFGGDDH